jgi:hypothetical protein
LRDCIEGHEEVREEGRNVLVFLDVGTADGTSGDAVEVERVEGGGGMETEEGRERREGGGGGRRGEGYGNQTITNLRHVVDNVCIGGSVSE